MAIRPITDVDLRNKRVMIRADLNVPIANGKVTNDIRIMAALKGIRYCLDQGAAVLVLSHLGRPTEGQFDPALSLAPVARRLADMVDARVLLKKDWLDGVEVQPGEVVLCENVRFNRGEKANNEFLAKQMAQLCDVFVMDAFGTAHRAHASTAGVAEYAKEACAGPLLMAELEALGQALKDPARPMLAIVGGSKVSGKLEVLSALSRRVNQLIVGGGICNTFIAAAGFEVGKSLYEPDLIESARSVISAAKMAGGEVPIPQDVVVARELSAEAPSFVKPVDQVLADEMILDIGPKALERVKGMVAAARTIVWNGPLGVFEIDQFGEGTKGLAEAVAASSAFSIAGGGDTLAALDKYGVANEVSYISTGGGAFLEFLQGKPLPGVMALRRN